MMFFKKQLMQTLPSIMNLFDLFTENEFSGVSTPVRSNIGETDADYFIQLAVPGFSKDAFDIRLDRDLLTISGTLEKKTDADKYLRKEYLYSSFKKSFTLPRGVSSDIDAKYTDGILEIRIPKKEKSAALTVKVK